MKYTSIVPYGKHKKWKLLFFQFTNLLLAEFGNFDDFISKKG